MSLETKALIDEKKKILEEYKQKAKRDFLLKSGIYTREYSDHGYSDEYKEYDYAKDMHYKIVPLDCTDEEYEQLKKYAPTGAFGFGQNKLSSILLGITIVIYVIGFFAGFFTYNEYSGFITVIVTWLVTFLIGLPVFVFAEIIRLLDIIAKK